MPNKLNIYLYVCIIGLVLTFFPKQSSAIYGYTSTEPLVSSSCDEIYGYIGPSIQFSSSDWISVDARTPGISYATMTCVGDGTVLLPQEGFDTDYFDVINTGTQTPKMLFWQHSKSFLTVYNETMVHFSVQYQDDYSNDPSTGYPQVVYWPANTQNCTTVSLSSSTTHWFYISDINLPCGTYNYKYIVKNDTCSLIYELETGSFVITERPHDVVNIGVQNAGYVTNSKILLKWTAVNPETGGTTYKVYIGKDSNNLTLAYTGTNNFFELDTLDYSSKYYWQVEAINIYGVSAKSSIYNFQTIGPVAKSYNYPNPFNPANNETTNIVFEMTDSGSAEISVYTEFGDLCWRKTFDSLNKGTNQISYDGRDDEGRELFNGTYVCKIKRKYGSGENSDKCRILIIK